MEIEDGVDQHENIRRHSFIHRLVALGGGVRARLFLRSLIRNERPKRRREGGGEEEEIHWKNQTRI
jgi:hypothetical protein